MYIYFDYISKIENVEIQHKLLCNEEVNVGPYYVDGYIHAKREIIEFAGSFFHFCQYVLFFLLFFAYIHDFLIRKTVFCGFVIIMTISLLVTSMVILCLTL